MQKKIELNMNALRSIAILMVILLHVNAESLIHLFQTGMRPETSFEVMQFYSILTRIAVPLFILISGRYILSGLGHITLTDFYKKKMPRLLIPLFAWSFIYFFVCSAHSPDTTIISYLKDFGSGFAHNSMAIHIWYLYMLIPLYLISPFLYQAIHYFSADRRIYFAILLCIFGSIVELLKNMTGINLWFLWWLEFTGLFVMGFILKDRKFINKSHLLLIISLAVELIATVCFIVLFTQGNESAFIFYWGVVPHTQIVAILIYLYFNSIKEHNNFLTRYSKYVLGIYLIHFMFIPLLGLPHYTGVLFIDILLKTILVSVISLISIALLSKIKVIKKILQ